MPLSVLVIVRPQKAKEARCRELLVWLSDEVKKNEPDTSMYSYWSHEGDDGEGLDFFVYFEYEYPTPTNVTFRMNSSNGH